MELHKLFKPMLAATCTDITKVNYPVLATPKIDGIRCVVLKGKALSRSLKPIPNDFIRTTIEEYFPDGCDGEITIPGLKFNEVSSAVMCKRPSENALRFKYMVFDVFDVELPCIPYETRVSWLRKLDVPSQYAQKLIPICIKNSKGLEKYEEECVEDGYEGVCFRSSYSPYKFGRSTERQGWLLKLKRFVKGEAKIIGFQEKMHNTNQFMDDSTSRRHTFSEGMVPMNTLGALVVRNEMGSFCIGTGFDEATRLWIWNHRKNYMGAQVWFKYQKYGTKDLPRLPVFIGFVE